MLCFSAAYFLSISWPLGFLRCCFVLRAKRRPKAQNLPPPCGPCGLDSQPITSNPHCKGSKCHGYVIDTPNDLWQQFVGSRVEDGVKRKAQRGQYSTPEKLCLKNGKNQERGAPKASSQKARITHQRHSSRPPTPITQAEGPQLHHYHGAAQGLGPSRNPGPSRPATIITRSNSSSSSSSSSIDDPTVSWRRHCQAGMALEEGQPDRGNAFTKVATSLVSPLVGWHAVLWFQGTLPFRPPQVSPSRPCRNRHQPLRPISLPPSFARISSFSSGPYPECLRGAEGPTAGGAAGAAAGEGGREGGGRRRKRQGQVQLAAESEEEGWDWFRALDYQVRKEEKRVRWQK